MEEPGTMRRRPATGFAGVKGVDVLALRSMTNAGRWRITPDRLSGLGYSAGSNLLLWHASTDDNRSDSDALRRCLARLGDLALLCLWPNDNPVAAYSIRPNPPSTFLCVTAEDSAALPAFSEGIGTAIRAAGGQVEVKILRKGDHLAFNFRENGPEVDWTPAFLDWLERQGLHGTEMSVPMGGTT